MDLNEALSRAEPDANTGAAGEFVIDSDLRTISIPAGFGSLGVESDDDVRRLKFRLPKMYGEFDLSEFDIRINYVNAGGQTDIYLVDDKAVDGDSITFSWLAGRTATKYKGSTRFIVCFKKSGSDGMIQREFNTTVAALPVLEGLEGTEAVVQQTPDIVEEILKIKGSFVLADNLTTTEAGKALDARQGQLLNAAQTAINTTISNLSDRLKGKTLYESAGFSYAENGKVALLDDVGKYGAVDIHYYCQSNSGVLPSASYYVRRVPVMGGAVKTNLIGQQFLYESMLGVSIEGSTLSTLNFYRRAITDNTFDRTYPQLYVYKIVGYA